MKVLDRLGNEIKIGDKIAWVATSYGNAYLKIGNVTEITAKFQDEYDDYNYDYEKHQRIPTGKKVRCYEVTIKADILHPYDLTRRYIARMPVYGEGVDGEELIVKVRRAEKI